MRAALAARFCLCCPGFYRHDYHPMTDTRLELTVLMPCLNEAKTLASCIRAAHKFLDEAGVQGEILVADNGSTDGSRDIALEAGARVLSVPQRGYGAALMAGIESARGRFVIMGDADESYDFSRLGGYIADLRGGSDLVMGNRFKGGIAAGSMPLLHRYLGNPVLSFIGRLFFRNSIGDYHCGLRGFSREAVLRLKLVTQGMEFASEMVAKSSLAGYRITEVPTTLSVDGRGRPSHLRTWRDGWRHLRFLLLFCPRWLFLYPGFALLLVGLLGFCLLQFGPVNLVRVGLDIHSLLYMAAATVLGTQLIQLALLTKWMGALAGIVPVPKWMERWPRCMNIEAGLIVGAALLLVGLIGSLRLVYDWGITGFGALEPREAMRAVIPSVTLMILGVQAAAGALFAGALHFCWRSSAQVCQA
jgi:glycosyltransferase involved in cell wall biosynthesis